MTSVLTPIGLPPAYRKKEVAGILSCIRAGDSCSIVGASGVAKSNLFRYLLQPEVRQHHLGPQWKNYLFVHLDANEVTEMTEQTISVMLVERLLEQFSGNSADGDAREPKPNAYSVATHKTLASTVGTILNAGSQVLVFIFDQFDVVYQTLNCRFFANLRAIRDQHKYRVSYVVLTRHKLMALASSQECEEFEELFSPNVIGLGPYARDDALNMLARIGQRFGIQLDSQTSERLIALTGGHPGLLKASVIALFKEEQLELPEEQAQAVAALLSVADVQSECEKLWNSLGDAEQHYLRDCVINKKPHPEPATQALLQMKGLVREQSGLLTPFSVVFAQHVATSKGVDKPSIKVRAGSLSIDTAGDVWVNEQRLTPALTKKELLLLEYLCLEPGRLRSKDEIIAVVYPDEYRAGDSISDDALNSLVKRLRDRLEPFNGLRAKIVTVRGRGYRLNAIENG